MGEDNVEVKKPDIFAVCELKRVGDHIEIECDTKENRDEIAKLLDKEIIVRVKAILVEPEIVEAPVVEPRKSMS